MPYQNVEPPVQLQESVKCFWFAERELLPPDPTFKIWPDSYIELVFCYADQPIYYLRGQREEMLPRLFILGLLNEPFILKSRGWIRSIGIRFFAWGFNDLIQLPPHEPLLEVESRFDALQRNLSDLASNPDPDHLMRTLQTFLLEQQDQAIASRKDDRITQVAKQIYLDRGTSRVTSMAKNIHLSERQFNRLFARQLGLSPKSLAKKVRFQYVRDAIYENPEINLTSLAYEFEYNDQSHLIKDFREFAGKTPSAFAKEMKQLKESLTTYNVRFLQ
ncbi:MAG TPA: helix-turn-helix domain-containing protein [Chitinophagaceae bacterium]|nr:helix-turn-helix domain-containing protein [Chitinophagaceae bacterium]